MDIERLETLAERFRAAAREFDQIQRRCEATVESWRWASAYLYDLRPYHFERSGHSRGRWLKQPPDLSKPLASPSHYGLDLRGEPVVERRYFPGSGGLYERQFFMRQADQWESLHFEGAKKWPGLIDLHRVELRDGRPASAAWYAKHQKGYEDYHYEGELLIRVEAVWSNQPFGPKRLLIAHWDLTYDDHGALATVSITYQPTEGHPGGTFPAYPKRRR